MPNYTSIIGEKIYTRNGTKEIDDLFGNKYFDFPKPSSLISELINQASNMSDEDIILDFFSGSGTTAHAIMQLNTEDDGNRKCISVQLPELTDEKSEAYKAGYKTIADIAKERIRRAGKKIKDDFGLLIADLETKIKELKRQLPTDENKAQAEKFSA